MKQKILHHKLPKIRIRLKWRAVHAVALAAALVALGAIIVFVYHYIVSTITYTNQTLELKKVVSPISFDKAEFETIAQNIQVKESRFREFDFTPLENIFLESRSAPPKKSDAKPDTKAPQKENTGEVLLR